MCAKLTNGFAFCSYQMYSSDICYDDIPVSLNLLEYRFVYFSLKEETLLEHPSFPAIKQTMSILSNENLPAHTSYKQALDIRHTAHKNPLYFPNFHFLLMHFFSAPLKGLNIFSIASDSSSLFKVHEHLHAFSWHISLECRFKRSFLVRSQYLLTINQNVF